MSDHKPETIAQGIRVELIRLVEQAGETCKPLRNPETQIATLPAHFPTSPAGIAALAHSLV